MLQRLLLALVCVGGATATARAQAPNLRSVIDDGLAELARRQQPNGSYENDVHVTAQALLAFQQSPRKYVEADGPFVRRAVTWLASQVGANGRPEGIADRDEAIGAAKWMAAALATARSDAGKQAAAKLATFLAGPDGQVTPERKPPSHLWTITVTSGADAAAAANLVGSLLKGWPQVRAVNVADFDRTLEAMPALLGDVATRFADLKIDVKADETQHWARFATATVLTTLQAPAGFEEASAQEIAAAVRTLTLCNDNMPKDSGAPGGAAPGGGAPAKPAGTPRTVAADLQATWREAATAALAYLGAQQKNGRFGFMGREDPGITALALSATIRTARRLGQPDPDWVGGGLDYLVSLQQKTGAIHAGGLAVYTTSAALMALTDAARPTDQAVIAKATTYLKVVQCDEGESYERQSDWGYGGIGYGSELRPDLSNTQFGLEGLHAGGVPAGDDSMQRAILFLQRCQNNPEFNPQPIQRADGRVVRSGTDGGAGYQPGESKAGLEDNGDGTFLSRSYGSMTYALLKCYLFAGLKLDDPRVAAALKWIQAHWNVDQNPGFDPKSSQGAEFQGLFYYWFTMAKALDASGLATLTTPDGKAHAWRDELLRKLLETSMNEGFWSNSKSSRWMEEFPVLASSYALIAMDHCLGARKSGQ
jgi:squalene-hopene/tetraprenyl-beta-curcumene cyclase